MTTAEELSGWFGTRAAVDLRSGGQATVWWEKQPATLGIHVVEPPHRLTYTRAIGGLASDDPRGTYLEFTLTPIRRGTRRQVVESGFAQLPPPLPGPGS